MSCAKTKNTGVLTMVLIGCHHRTEKKKDEKERSCEEVEAITAAAPITRSTTVVSHLTERGSEKVAVRLFVPTI